MNLPLNLWPKCISSPRPLFEPEPQSRRPRLCGESRISRSRPAGFTLIEVLTVIAIILVLVGLFFGGWKKWSATEARQLTITRMEMLNAMLADLEAAGHNQYQAQWFIPTTVYLDASQFGNISTIDLTPYNNTSNPSFVPANDQININGTLTTIAVCSYPNALNYMAMGVGPSSPSQQDLLSGPSPSVATAYTPPYGIMTRLMTLPNTPKEMSQLPSNAVVTTAGPAKAGLSTSSTAPVVLDGWGNPIIFVPAGGLINVYLNTSTPSASKPPNNLIASPDGRPFWVSAGPDGDLTRGDDNIYSFDLH